MNMATHNIVVILAIGASMVCSPKAASEPVEADSSRLQFSELDELVPEQDEQLSLIQDEQRPLSSRVSPRRITARLAHLYAIAQTSGGIRAIGTIGFNRSVHMIYQELTDLSNFAITRQDWHTSEWVLLSPTRVSHSGGEITERKAFIGSGSGTVRALVLAVSRRGCDPADYDENVRGRIALVRRGQCSFDHKIKLAVQAGSVGVLIFNSGDYRTQKGLFSGSCTHSTTVPVVSLPHQVGMQLAETAPEISLSVHAKLRAVQSSNLCAESKGGNPDSEILVGAHLDSVAAGPGINDNGSGSMMILEIAVQLSRMLRQERPLALANKVRFCWWGGEEEGMLGSNYYVSQLNREQVSKIALVLNFDMVASPNFKRGVYNGTEALTFGGRNAEYTASASHYITRLLAGRYESLNKTVHLTHFDGRSDYGPFLNVGVPAGGLESGADNLKSQEEQRQFGGTAGQAFDHCYHSACDNFDNINNTLSQHILADITDATAFGLERMLASPHLREWLQVQTHSHYPLLEGLSQYRP